MCYTFPSLGAVNSVVDQLGAGEVNKFGEILGIELGCSEPIPPPNA